MADLVLASNEVSPMISAFVKNVEDLSYDIPKSFPGIVKQLEKQTPSGSATLSNACSNRSEAIFNINRTMFLYGLMIEHQVAFTTNNDGYKLSSALQYGKTILSLIELSSNNKPIWRITGNGLLARYSDMNGDMKSLIDRVTTCMDSDYKPLSATAASARFFTYVPASIFESVRTALELSKTEQLTLRIQYNSVNGAGLVSATDLTTVVPYLWGYKYTMDKRNYDLILASNMNKPGGLMLQQWSNFYNETYVLTSADTTGCSIRLSNNYPVHKTHFFLVGGAETDGSLTTTGASIKPAWIRGSVDFVPITQFKFQVGGQDVLVQAPSMVMNFDADKFGGQHGYYSTGGVDTARVSNIRGVITINWGLLGDSRYENSGCVSFAQLNNPTLVLTYPTLSTTLTNYRVEVVHEYWQQVAKDGAGTMQVVLAQ